MQLINFKASFYSLITTLRLIVIASAGPSLTEPFSPLHGAQSPHRCRLTWITPSSLKETILLKLLQYFEKTRWKIEFLKTISSSMQYVWTILDISDPDMMLAWWFFFHHFSWLRAMCFPRQSPRFTPWPGTEGRCCQAQSTGYYNHKHACQAQLSLFCFSLFMTTN